jgi:hypothetical protein
MPSAIEGTMPTWTAYGSLLERSARGEVYRSAVAWALRELRSLLDDEWLRRAAAARRPPLLGHLAFASVWEEASPPRQRSLPHRTKRRRGGAR